MKIPITSTTGIITLAALFSVASADNVRYNTFYDNSQTSLNNVACSDGRNGLITKGFTTFGSLPSFPNIGAAKAIGAWNSPLCGSCWELTYGGNTIYVTAIDTVGDGFDLSLKAMNTLTNGKAQQLDVVNAQATQVDESYCGL
ncbi:Cerato-platanin [Lactarius akahatsu]|uniref:Cerato-platanin n=1 Tax=Lactarius akahatsu TaxID=416441 RepID=A0AAD4LH29_9AGAM|nr:Cerato-platanin [Lactarius akahatsu]